MSNHSKHIAVKNDYYSGKTFGSASAHNQYIQLAKNEFILTCSHVPTRPLA
jgi:hypothetical protein